MKHPMLIPDFNQVLKRSTILNFMEMFPVRAALIHGWKENRRTDIMKTKDAFRHYANASSKSLCWAGPHSATVVVSARGEEVMQSKMLGLLLKILFENRFEKQWWLNMKYINNCPTRSKTKQSIYIYYSASSLYTFRVSTTPIIRSTQNCNYSLRYWSYFLCSYLPPKWPSLVTLEGGSCSFVYSWWCVWLTPETCRVKLQNNK
jgi:hypothetical protein